MVMVMVMVMGFRHFVERESSDIALMKRSM